MDINMFRDPPKEFREVPFWSWNDALEPEELVRQIRLMDEAGWGGFFMHSRVGLVTPYMGERWMACVRACIDEARARGMDAWLYDEDKWPSGFAGGLSVAAHPEYRIQWLVCKLDNRPALVAERIATFQAREVGGRLVDVALADEPELMGEDARVIQFYPQRMALGHAWFNDYAYLSLLNPEAVREFLRTTHEVYADEVGDAFGGTVPGIFTDEPAIIFRGGSKVGERFSIPWAADFPAVFEARNGYDLLPHLPSLFFDVGDCRAVRYDYWRTVTERYVESFSQVYGDWCREHGLAFTGHYMAEDTLASQVEQIGAAMPHYPAMDVPGIDKLGRQINGFAGTVLTVKQLDSAVCQLGKRRALCENYGCAGQDFAHTGRKWIGDWAYVLGVTLNNPHLALYSMRGARKRDYPQVVFYQQPWWPENHLVADYFARLSYALSQGRRVVDVLVLHPIGSAWALFRPGASREVDALDEPLDALLMALLNGQRDFHLGDELLMAPEGAAAARVEGSAEEGDGPRLLVGEMAYRVVIVPPSVTLARSTVELLRAFARAGGPVLALEPLPTRIDGRERGDDDPVLPASTQTVALEDLQATLDGLLPFDVRVVGRESIWAHHRRADGADWVFLANTDRERGGRARVLLRGGGRVEAWDAATGERAPLASRVVDGVSELTLDFPPVGSHLLRRTEAEAPAAGAPGRGRTLAELPLAGDWEVSAASPNALTLDTVRYRVGEGAWSEPTYILFAHDEIAAAGVGSPFALRYRFDVAERPAGPVSLVLETPGRFGVTVNGRAMPSGDDGWWIDTAFRKLDISDAVRAGRNEVLLEGVFGLDSELESVYVVGAFGVEGRRLGRENRFNGQVFDRYGPAFRIVAAPRTVAATEREAGPALDLTAAGFPFLAGRVRLRQRVTVTGRPERALLALDGLRAAVVRVRVDGVDAGAVAWPPHEVDVSGHVHPGVNEIEVELVGTLRNLLGPHHLRGGDLAWTSAAEFRDENRWTDDVILTPFGFDGARLVVMERRP